MIENDLMPPTKTLMVTRSYEFNGGAVFSERNYKALCSVLGKENIEIFDLAKYSSTSRNDLIKKISNRISNVINSRIFVDIETENTLVEKSKGFSIVFIDRSIYGLIVKKIKKSNPKVKIITYFQNLELNFHIDFGVMKRKVLWRIFSNEKMICKYSDVTISLNNRDAQKIEQTYNKKIDAIIPISFANRQINFNKGSISKIPTALFYGSNFPPNTHGIRWFIENVLPFSNLKLQVIIKDIDKENLPQSDKLELLGFVEKLEPYIQNADFTLFPIFKGSGMKVKTCEALMHGKNIIGTKEAFEGYDIDFEKIGACCETANEFIKKINEFPQKFTSKFNDYSRKLFLEKYNDDVVNKMFAELLKKIKE